MIDVIFIVCVPGETVFTLNEQIFPIAGAGCGVTGIFISGAVSSNTPHWLTPGTKGSLTIDCPKESGLKANNTIPTPK